jgi:hypothetical protein
MSFFDDMPLSTKVSLLEQARTQLATELTSILLRHGIDPSVFDINNKEEMSNYEFSGDVYRVEQVCEGLTIIETKLVALGV